jgi:hypothetical protein
MGYYNYQVTGDLLTMPYQMYSERYDVAPIFIFGRPEVKKTYNHSSMESYHTGFVMEGYIQKKKGAGLTLEHLRLPIQFFWGSALFLPVLFAFGRPGRRWAILAASVLALSVLASAVSSYADKLRPHYIAPAAPMFVLLAVRGIRRLRIARLNNRRAGRFVSDTVVAISLLSLAGGLLSRVLFGAAYQDVPLVRDRPAIIERLLATPEKDLVIVDYSPQHNEHEEWIYNRADLLISDAEIIWARDLGFAKNSRLHEYYPNRTTWRLYADENPPKLVPYEILRPTGR